MCPFIHAAHWSNWAGNVSSRPYAVLQPNSEEELRAYLQQAWQKGQRMRPVGASHSFSGVVATDEVMIKFDRFCGLIHYDAQSGLVTVGAGTRLFELGRILQGLGRAQENMGDINRQTVVGATSTGTHGTGIGYGGISTQIAALRLMDVQGRIHIIDERTPDLLDAARLSLGALGMVTEVTLRTVPAYQLQLDIFPSTLDEMLALLDEYVHGNRHFEFFWIPYTKGVQAKRSNVSHLPEPKRGLINFTNDLMMENMGVWALSEINKFWPQSTQTVCQTIARCITPNRRILPSAEVFGSARLVKFTEMEYALPIDSARAALRDIERLLWRCRFPISMPIEVRFAQADQLWLSTAHQRDSVYIAVHVYKGVEATQYFREVEQIFRHYDGRPHWGKCHNLTATELSRLYPRFADFLALRQQFDPERRLSNAYLQQVLGD